MCEMESELPTLIEENEFIDMLNTILFDRISLNQHNENPDLPYKHQLTHNGEDYITFTERKISDL